MCARISRAGRLKQIRSQVRARALPPSTRALSARIAVAAAQSLSLTLWVRGVHVQRSEGVQNHINHVICELSPKMFSACGEQEVI